MIAALTPGESWTLVLALLLAALPVGALAVRASAALWKLVKARQPKCCLVCEMEDAWDGQHCRRCEFTLPNGEEQS